MSTRNGTSDGDKLPEFLGLATIHVKRNTVLASPLCRNNHVIPIFPLFFMFAVCLAFSARRPVFVFVNNVSI